MPSPILSIRLPKPLRAALVAFCVAQGQQPSMVVRDALRDLLRHPERWPDILVARHSSALEEGLQTTWEQATEGLEAVDMAALMAEVCVDISTWKQ
jgi:hypothetical protein